MKKFAVSVFLLLLFVLVPEAHALPDLSIVDQNDNSYLLSELMSPGGLIIVYRAKEAAEAGNAHLSIAREFLSTEVTVVRLADLSRVPRLFRGLAARQLKSDFTGYPYYIDTAGELADFFGVKDGYCGIFLYNRSGQKKGAILEYGSEQQFQARLREFLSAAL